MDLVKRELDCAKETVEFGEGLAKLVNATREALSDGWQTGEDLPAIITSAVSDLVPALQGMEKISDELKTVPSFANAVYASLTPIFWSFLKKEEQE